MEPIINPTYFYLIDVFSTLKPICVIITVIMAIAFVVSFFADEVNKKRWTIAHIASGIGCVIFLFAHILIPSESTMYKIAIAKYATPDNIEAITEYVSDTASAATDKVAETVVDIIDYAGEKVYELRNNVSPSEGE